MIKPTNPKDYVGVSTNSSTGEASFSSSPSARGFYAKPFQFTKNDPMSGRTLKQTTTGGQPIMSHFDHEAHAKFGPQDHKEAAAAHQNHYRELKGTNANADLLKFHEDQHKQHWQKYQESLGGRSGTLTKSLYENIRKRREKGLAPKKPGQEGYPTDKAFQEAEKTAKSESLAKGDLVDLKSKTNLGDLPPVPRISDPKKAGDLITQAKKFKISKDSLNKAVSMLDKTISAEAMELGQYKGENLQPQHHARIAREYKEMARKASNLGDKDASKRFVLKALKHKVLGGSEPLAKGDVVDFKGRMEAFKASKAKKISPPSAGTPLSREDKLRAALQKQGKDLSPSPGNLEGRGGFSSSRDDAPEPQPSAREKFADQTKGGATRLARRQALDRMKNLLRTKHGEMGADVAEHLLSDSLNPEHYSMRVGAARESEPVPGKPTKTVKFHGESPEGHKVFSVGNDRNWGHFMVLPKGENQIRHVGAIGRLAGTSANYADTTDDEMLAMHDEVLGSPKDHALAEKELRSTKLFSKEVPSLAKYKDVGEFNKNDYRIAHGPHRLGLQVKKKGGSRFGQSNEDFQYSAENLPVPADHAEYNQMKAERAKADADHQTNHDALYKENPISSDEYRNNSEDIHSRERKAYTRMQEIEQSQPRVIRPKYTQSKEHHDAAIRFFNQHLAGHSKLKNAYGEFSLQPEQNPRWAEKGSEPAKPNRSSHLSVAKSVGKLAKGDVVDFKSRMGAFKEKKTSGVSSTGPGLSFDQQKANRAKASLSANQNAMAEARRPGELRDVTAESESPKEKIKRAVNKPLFLTWAGLDDEGTSTTQVYLKHKPEKHDGLQGSHVHLKAPPVNEAGELSLELERHVEDAGNKGFKNVYVSYDGGDPKSMRALHENYHQVKAENHKEHWKAKKKDLRADNKKAAGMAAIKAAMDKAPAPDMSPRGIAARKEALGLVVSKLRPKDGDQ